MTSSSDLLVQGVQRVFSHSRGKPAPVNTGVGIHKSRTMTRSTEDESISMVTASMSLSCARSATRTGSAELAGPTTGRHNTRSPRGSASPPHAPLRLERVLSSPQSARRCSPNTRAFCAATNRHGPHHRERRVGARLHCAQAVRPRGRASPRIQERERTSGEASGHRHDRDRLRMRLARPGRRGWPHSGRAEERRRGPRARLLREGRNPPHPDRRCS